MSTPTKLWVDQYRPRSLDDFTYNTNAVDTFRRLAKKSTDIPHLIVEGISGIGKKSLVMAFIRECLINYGLKGDEIYRTNNMKIELKYPNKKIELNIQKSLYHYNLNPSDYGIYDRHIVQDFLKTQFRYKRLTGFPYKTVIIRSAENLSVDAQQSLRRTLENCIKNCRFIFIVDTEKQGTLIPALISRCIRIRMAAPRKMQGTQVINRILEREHHTPINPQLIANLYQKNNRSLTKTINLIQLMSNIYSTSELSRLTNVKMHDICPITLCCNQIVTEMFSSDNLNMITGLRTRIYTLLTHGINPEEIIKRIFKIAINNLPGLELPLIELTTRIESHLTKSSREFYHIEDYIVKLLVLIKTYQINPKRHRALPPPELPIPTEPLDLPPLPFPSLPTRPTESTPSSKARSEPAPQSKSPAAPQSKSPAAPQSKSPAARESEPKVQESPPDSPPRKLTFKSRPKKQVKLTFKRSVKN